MTANPLGAAVMARLEALAGHTDEPDKLTRLYLSPAHKTAAAQVMIWMEQAGMTTRIDAVANVVGRYEGTRPGLPALLLGSHIDTVRDAGKYDGNLGVLAAIACVETLHTEGVRLPFAIEVLAFGDEEGVRFPTTLIGSRAVAGTLDPQALEARDADGVSVGEALAAFGCNPAELPAAAPGRAGILGYIELHIEQGPVLEAEDLPVGIVTAINGASRAEVQVCGEAGHAGTVPMPLRHDALAGAAEMVLAIERIGGATPDLVATVGRLDALPGAVNVIPGEVRFTIDLRAPDDTVRRRAVAAIQGELDAVAGRRGLRLEVRPTHDAGAATCDPRLIEQLEAAVVRCGIRPLRLPSGAGHDAMALAASYPIGMLFVRCEGGISHNPAEAVTAGDVDAAVRVLLELLRTFEPK